MIIQPPKNRIIPKVFSELQIERILHHILTFPGYAKDDDYGRFMRYRDLAIIATIYFLALRPLEALNLRFDDFNFNNMTVRIRGCSNKLRKERTLPVPKKLISIYKEYFKIFPRARFWKGKPYLFPSRENHHLGSSRMKVVFRRKILEPLGLYELSPLKKVPETRLYILRHSRASQILNKQIKKNGKPDLFSLANILGHQDLRHTTVYLHTDEKYMNYLKKQMEF